MKYKGYHAEVTYDHEAAIFHGEVVGTRDVIFFEGTSVDQLNEEFRFSIDDYLAVCAERDREPDKPYSGRIPLRIPPRPSPRSHRRREIGGQEPQLLDSRDRRKGRQVHRLVLHVYQHSRIQYPVRVQRPLRRTQRLREHLRPLPVIPRPVQSSDRVMVCDRASSLDNGVRSRLLDCGLLTRVVAAAIGSSGPRAGGRFRDRR